MTEKNQFQPAIPASDAGYIWGTWEEREAALLAHASFPPQLLLVEADTGLQAFLEIVLSEEGYALRMVASLEQALSLISVQRFDLVLADLFADTPRKVFKALEPLRERIQPIKLGLLTSWDVSPEVAENQGVAFVLRKPVAVDQLLAEIAICLDKALTPEQERQGQVVELFLGVLILKERRQALSLCTEDIVSYPPALPLLPLAHPIRGKAALERYIEVLRSSYQAVRLEVQAIYSRPKGLVVRYHMWWTPAHGSWEMMGGTLLFQFTSDRIRQIGLQADKH